MTTPNKRGPKKGTSSFTLLSLEEVLDLITHSPDKKIPVRRTWVEETAAKKFTKDLTSAQDDDKVEPVIVQELDLDETIDENDTRNW